MSLLAKEQLIAQLQLEPHVEGGYFRQIYNEGEFGNRPFFTSIYFLLGIGDVSKFHVLTADEVWYHHCGSPLEIHMINPDGSYQVVLLGSDIAAGQVPQYKVNKGVIFGSRRVPTDTQEYGLVSCMVAPGFTYDDFKLFNRAELTEMYPQYAAQIAEFTNP